MTTHHLYFPLRLAFLAATMVLHSEPIVGFAPRGGAAFLRRGQESHQRRRPPPSAERSIGDGEVAEPSFTRVSEEDEGIALPFLDEVGNSFIECYADSVATVAGVEYTIGVPCDYCVALCYMEDEDLIPVELNDKLMDDIFPIAENIVNEEFGEDLALQRTPQTLTLVGELEDEDDDDGTDDEDDDPDDGEDEVEILLSFDHRDKEFSLVRLMDPVLVVGKSHPERPDMRVLLTPEESEKVMPLLESAFLKYHEDGNSMLP
jgi:Protein of unknown function (DUF3727)